MNHCAGCIHWGRESVKLSEDIPGASRYPKGWGLCTKTETNAEQPIDPLTMARAMDSRGEQAVLWTAPMFGCNQWVKRTERV